MEENSIIKDKKDKMLMIVIGCLSVVLILLFIFFLVERSENKKHIAAIHEEKQLLEQELTDLSHNYDDLKTSNDTLNEKLQLEQEKILTLMDQMKKFRDNSYAEINRYKKEIGTLKNVLRSYVVQIDSLNQLNQKLAKENTEVRKQMNWVRERNQKLENQQKDMKEVIAQASALRTENFVVYPVNKRDKEKNKRKKNKPSLLENRSKHMKKLMCPTAFGTSMRITGVTKPRQNRFIPTHPTPFTWPTRRTVTI